MGGSKVKFSQYINSVNLNAGTEFPYLVLEFSKEISKTKTGRAHTDAPC